MNWANAHPHLDASERVAVVHNGIVENYRELKEGLISRGYTFSSDTDTECLALLLVEEMHSEGVPLPVALKRVFPKISGLNAIVAIDLTNHDLAAAKTGSPLYLGFANDAHLIASDAAAFLPWTDRTMRIGDGHLVSLTADGLELFNIQTTAELEVSEEKISWSREAGELGEFSTYLEKEIREQPQILRELATPANLKSLRELAKLISPNRRTWLLGCGSALHAAHLGERFFRAAGFRCVEAIAAHEFTDLSEIIDRSDLVIALSQSGETIDLLDATRFAKQLGCQVMGIVNVPGSTLAREVDFLVPINAGPEKSVLSTKAYSGMVGILLALSKKGSFTASDDLLLAASEMEQLLSDEVVNEIGTLGYELRHSKNLFVLGMGYGYPLALEAALKIKEVSYVHAEGFACGELKHGVIALLEQDTPCIVFSPTGHWGERAKISIDEVRARGARVINIGERVAGCTNNFPVHASEAAFALAAIIPAQLLALQLATVRGLDADKPRNLAKSVTVR